MYLLHFSFTTPNRLGSLWGQTLSPSICFFQKGVADLDQMFIPGDGDEDDYDDGDENDDDEESTMETTSEEYDDFADVDSLGLVMEGKLALKNDDDELPSIKKVMRILPEDMENETELHSK